MGINEIHKEDVGTILRMTVQDSGIAIDVSSASGVGKKLLLLRKPGGTVVEKTLSFTDDGTDGQVQYTTLTDDLNEDGEWGLQVYLGLTAGKRYSDIQNFIVHRNLKAVI